MISALPDFSQLLASLRSYDRNINGALVDQYTFASQQHLLGPDEFLVEALIPNPLVHGFLVTGLGENQRQCVSGYAERNKHVILEELMKWIKPITVRREEYWVWCFGL